MHFSLLSSLFLALSPHTFISFSLLLYYLTFFSSLLHTSRPRIHTLFSSLPHLSHHNPSPSPSLPHSTNRRSSGGHFLHLKKRTSRSTPSLTQGGTGGGAGGGAFIQTVLTIRLMDSTTTHNRYKSKQQSSICEKNSSHTRHTTCPPRGDCGEEECPPVPPTEGGEGHTHTLRTEDAAVELAVGGR